MNPDNYVCTLDPACVKKAKDELNEVPEDRLAAVQAFREWIQAQPHITCPNTETIFLLQFLRHSKFSQVRAREKFEYYLNLRNTLPKTYNNLDPSEEAVQAIIRCGYAFPLPKKDKEGRAIIFSTVDKLAEVVTKYGIPKLYSATTIILEYLSQSESTQVNGFVFIADCSGVSAKLVSRFMTSEVGNHDKECIKGMPGRYKMFHYYKCGVLIDTMLAFMKPFVPKKFVERSRFHETMESMYEYIPKECLPLEYLPDDYTGPSAGSMNDIIGYHFLQEWMIFQILDATTSRRNILDLRCVGPLF